MERWEGRVGRRSRAHTHTTLCTSAPLRRTSCTIQTSWWMRPLSSCCSGSCGEAGQGGVAGIAGMCRGLQAGSALEAAAQKRRRVAGRPRQASSLEGWAGADLAHSVGVGRGHVWVLSQRLSALTGRCGLKGRSAEARAWLQPQGSVARPPNYRHAANPHLQPRGCRAPPPTREWPLRPGLRRWASRPGTPHPQSSPRSAGWRSRQPDAAGRQLPTREGPFVACSVINARTLTATFSPSRHTPRYTRPWAPLPSSGPSSSPSSSSSLGRSCAGAAGDGECESMSQARRPHRLCSRQRRRTWPKGRGDQGTEIGVGGSLGVSQASEEHSCASREGGGGWA